MNPATIDTESGSEAMALDRLAEALVTVQRRCPALAVFAIRWMQMKHPLHPVQLLLLHEHLGMSVEVADRAERGAWAATRWIHPVLLRRMVQCVVYACSVSGRLLHLRLRLPRQAAGLLRQRFDVVIKTCGFGPARPADGRDFYFGDLQHQLTTRGLRTLVLCGDARGGSWIAFAKNHLAPAPSARLPELALLHPLAPFRLMAAQFMTSGRLRRLASTMRDPLVTRICRLASRDCLEPDTARAALYFWIMKTAVRTWRPRAFVTLYEGHAWELCARWGAKAADAACRTVGYQHTAVFPESLSLMAPPDAAAVRLPPDVVLGSGPIPLELMAPGHARAQARLVRFGSFRYCRPEADRPADRGRRVILVTPEGIVSEVKALFEFAWACAARLPQYTFVLRCHPEVPIATALRAVSIDLAAQPNVQWSDRPIEEDFARSSAILYRGSSAAAYAVLHGLLPIYVHGPGRYDQDPLYGLSAWRMRCGTPEELAEALARYERSPMDRLEPAWQAAVRYLHDCIEPVTDDRLEALIDAAGLRSPARPTLAEPAELLSGSPA